MSLRDGIKKQLGSRRNIDIGSLKDKISKSSNGHQIRDRETAPSKHSKFEETKVSPSATKNNPAPESKLIAEPMLIDSTSFVDQSTMNTTVSKTMLEAINSS